MCVIHKNINSPSKMLKNGFQNRNKTRKNLPMLKNQVGLWSFAPYIDDERQSEVQRGQEGGDRAQGSMETTWIGANKG
jgi:hypothetical protein